MYVHSFFRGIAFGVVGNVGSALTAEVVVDNNFHQGAELLGSVVMGTGVLLKALHKRNSFFAGVGVGLVGAAVVRAAYVISNNAEATSPRLG